MQVSIYLRPLAAASALVVAAATTAAAADLIVSSQQATFRVTTFASGLDQPWGLAFLPDGTALVTEKGGTLRRVAGDGTVSAPIAGVPEVDSRGQGGLLDVAVDPAFADNRRVYLSFSEPGPDGVNSTAVARGVLADDATALTDVAAVFSQKPKLPSTAHFGSRLAFDAAGDLFITTGERSAAQFRDGAQDLGSGLGKIMRVHPDGEIPEDNPFVRTEGAQPEVWSYGHRNVQAAAFNPQTGELWEIEHGPMGGDEINIARAGRNYGWPVVSFGKNYDGTPVGSGKSAGEGFEPPLYQWTPVIAPSGMTFYAGDMFPEWKGDLLVGGLKVTSLVRLELDGEKVIGEERLLTDLGHRIRDVVVGPAGAVYLLTDEEDGQILKLDRPS